MSGNVTRRQTELLLDGHATLSTLDALLHNLQSGILFESIERKVIFVNQKFSTFFDTPSPGELVGVDCRDLAQYSKTLYVDPEHFIHRIETSIFERKLVYKEELRLSDGRIFERDYIPVYVNEVYIGHLWQFHDRTEQKRLEEKLTKTVTQLAEAQRIAHLGSWELEPKTGLMSWSDEMYHLMGVQQEEFTVALETVLQLVYPDDRVGLATLVERARREHLPYSFEHRIVHPDGTTRMVHSRGAVAEAGQVIKLFGTVQDITERKRVEEKLRDSEERLRAQYNNLPVPTHTWQRDDDDFVMVDYNTAANSLSQGRAHDLLGQLASVVYHQRPDIVNDFSRCFTKKTTFKRAMPYRLVTTGEDRHFVVSYVFVPPDMVMVHTEDITERKRAEEQRAELLRREQAARAEVEATSERITRLQKVTAALIEVVTPEEVASAIVEHGIAALNSSTCTIVLLTESGTELEILCSTGYTEDRVEKWRRFPLTADTPISEAVRTGQPVWLESTQIAVRRYPHLAAEFTQASGNCWASMPLLIGTECIGALGLRFADADGLSEANREFILALAHQCAQALHRVRLFEQVRDGREQLQTLSFELMAAQETERRQIARELHDEIGQALTALKINIRSLSRSSDAAAVQPFLQENLGIIDGVLQQVRDLSLDLRPPMLDDLGLVAALNWSLFRQSERNGFAATFVPDSQLQRLPTYIETTCYRVAQEALTNIARHAQAQNVRVEVRELRATEEHKAPIEHTAQVELIVQDDGVGFDAAAALQNARQGRSFGLLGMQERVLLVGGDFKVDSAPGRGTQIRVLIPISLDSDAVERRDHHRDGNHEADSRHPVR